jgi:hypothetical protein
VRSRQLHSSLSDYVDAAAALLRGELAGGAEVPFEIGSQSSRGIGRGTPLYCYRALTGSFIAEREAALQRLPAFVAAAKALEEFDGLDRYLGSVAPDARAGRGGARGRIALRALLEDVFAEQSDFDLRPERVRAALERLESSAIAGPKELTLLVALQGVVISSPQLQMATGLSMVQAGTLEDVPAQVLAAGGDERDDAQRVLAYYSAADGDLDGSLAAGCERLGALLRALRLFGDGRVAFASLGWARVGAGPWVPVALGAGPTPRGMLVVAVDQEDELRAFCNLVSRRAPKSDRVAWALRRFELGCDRVSPRDALTDHLLALRALLEPEGAQVAMLAGRVATLCAKPQQRAALAERVAAAVELEHALIEGAAVKQSAVAAASDELAQHLRALLSDVICGHLEPDLPALADDLLLAGIDAQDAEAADQAELAGEPDDCEGAEVAEPADPVAEPADLAAESKAAECAGSEASDAADEGDGDDAPDADTHDTPDAADTANSAKRPKSSKAPKRAKARGPDEADEPGDKSEQLAIRSG